jgi:hypothetical protein
MNSSKSEEEENIVVELRPANICQICSRASISSEIIQINYCCGNQYVHRECLLKNIEDKNPTCWICHKSIVPYLQTKINYEFKMRPKLTWFFLNALIIICFGIGCRVMVIINHKENPVSRLCLGAFIIGNIAVIITMISKTCCLTCHEDDQKTCDECCINNYMVSEKRGNVVLRYSHYYFGGWTPDCCSTLDKQVTEDFKCGDYGHPFKLCKSYENSLLISRFISYYGMVLFTFTGNLFLTVTYYLNYDVNFINAVYSIIIFSGIILYFIYFVVYPIIWISICCCFKTNVVLAIDETKIIKTK